MQPTLIYFVFVSATIVALNKSFKFVFGLGSCAKDDRYCNKLPFTDVDGNCSIAGFFTNKSLQGM